MTPQEQIDLLETGDRVGFEGKAWVSKEIIKAMTRYAIRKLHFTPTWVPSHWATTTKCEGVVTLHGSVEKGFRPELWEDAMKGNPSFRVYRIKDGYSPEQKQKVVRMVITLEKVSVIYAYWTLIAWWLLVYLNIDWFLKHAPMRCNVCYSSTKMILEEAAPNGIPYNPRKVDAFQCMRSDDSLIFHS